MGQEISSSHFSESDFAEFDAHLRAETELLEHWFQEGRLADHTGVGGFELESWLVDSEMQPAPVNAAVIERVGGDLVVPELASFNLELNAPPQELEGVALGTMRDDLQTTWDACNRCAAELGAELVMIGTLPTACESEFNLDNMSSMKRYQALNEQVLRLRGGKPLALRIDGRSRLRTEHANLMLEAATTSFQIHLQVAPHEAARFYNASKILSAPMVAVAANSPYLFGHDLWDETRIPLFEQAVSVEGPQSPNRVTFGFDYLRDSLFECFSQNRDAFPILLPKAGSDATGELSHLRLHNGTIWRWNRPLIGFDTAGVPHLRIEHRVVPAGPTVTDCIANAALFFGAVTQLGRSADPPERGLAFTTARENFYRAARFGLEATIVWLDGREVPIRDVLAQYLLPLAREGLAGFGLNPGEIEEFLGVIEGRVRSGRNGAAWQRAYVERHGPDMQALTYAYLQRQRSGRPVHEWGF
ncbi:MAG: glutamate--cysteine ligase [Proteobacteria bacterium]|nr:MAG: glutamate--cysteine ligase [Pseudomonadota bacterium]QKK11329.1 MAG: glutamate--cysteine ligase [Pseudomonadota bacterium]